MGEGATIMELNLLTAGRCYQYEKVVRKDGRIKLIPFPATFALIHHPVAGYILFDTGYSAHNFTEMQAFPYRIYQWITPIHLAPGESAKEQLLARGIQPQAIRTIILSHLHADHVGGCRDFPQATFLCSSREYAKIGGKRGFAALKEAFVPGLLPADFLARAKYVEDTSNVEHARLSTHFNEIYDLFGDGKLLAVFLPGHTAHQFGLYVENDGAATFYISDACWTHEAYRSLKLPASLARLVKSDYAQYLDTVQRLHQFYLANPDVTIIPCHANGGE
jgi:glyoxylase-like metal-dependent hydrolase (beta-lactamase superfamily II)